jgi:hypothetical protein
MPSNQPEKDIYRLIIADSKTGRTIDDIPIEAKKSPETWKQLPEALKEFGELVEVQREAMGTNIFRVDVK